MRYGGLDLLVSNAGVLRAGGVTTQPLADFDLVTRVNYRGYFVCVRFAAPVMARQHAARPAWLSDIVEINSKSGLAGSSRNSAYAGSKFGGIGLTQSFALELVGDGIKVNAVCPGNFFDGPLWSDPDNGLFVQYLREGKVPGATTVEDVRHFYEAKVPMGRGCDPADVLEAIYYLVAQQYETGQALPGHGRPGHAQLTQRRGATACPSPPPPASPSRPPSTPSRSWPRARPSTTGPSRCRPRGRRRSSCGSRPSASASRTPSCCTPSRTIPARAR